MLYSGNELYLEEIMESFKIITETFEDVDDFDEFFELHTLDESDKSFIKKKIDEYIKESKKLSVEARKNNKSGLLLNFIGVGISLLGTALAINFPVIGIITALSSAILTLIAVIKYGTELIKTSKIINYKNKLKNLYEKAKNNKDRNEIKKAIDKMDILIKNTKAINKEKNVY